MKRRLFSHFDFFPNYKPGKTCQVIRSFDQLTKNDSVFLILRVSNCERKRNLKDQEVNLRIAVRRVGAKIVGKFS